MYIDRPMNIRWNLIFLDQAKSNKARLAVPRLRLLAPTGAAPGRPGPGLIAPASLAPAPASPAPAPAAPTHPGLPTYT
jgi:hypothetical protein